MFRFYENEYPNEGNIVMAKVKSIEDNGVTVSLLEYGIDGLIPYNQLARRKIRSIKKMVSIGSQQVVEVISVDETKGYVDLSKSTVTESEKQEKLEEWGKTKMIDSMMESISRKIKCTKQHLYEKNIWPLSHKFENLSVFNILEKSLLNPEMLETNDDQVFDWLSEYLNKEIAKIIMDYYIEHFFEEIKITMVEEIHKKFAPKMEKFQVNIELTCYNHEEGINMIKKALKIAVDKGFDVRVYACPIYTINKKYLTLEEAEESLNSVCEEIQEFITQNGGSMKIDKPARLLKE